MALAAALLLSVSCTYPTVPENAALVKANKQQVAFFDRPVAIAAAQASGTPYPVIVMLSANPWLPVVGSDSPTFALYSDGTAIFQTKDGFRSIQLSRDEQDEMIRVFENPDLVALAGGYEVSESTDQPNNSLLFYGSKTPLYISVYGDLHDEEVRAKLPQTVIAAFDRLRDFQPPNAQAWLPSEVEVMAWPYEYAPDRSIIWPERWPDLTADTTRKRGDSYSIFVASTELPALEKFLASRSQRGAIEISGKKLAASIRLPFPHESLWMAPKTD